VLDLTTYQSRLVVPGSVRAIVVGRKTPTIYYTKRTDDRLHASLWAANVDTGESRKVADLPPRGGISTINADETLACGNFLESDPPPSAGLYSGAGAARPQTGSQNTIQPANKGEMMQRRLAAKLPITMYTVDLRTGRISFLIQHSTDWLNHMQFSPTDPTLLMYCHEGPWYLVDRIWTIRTDGTQNRLVHQRTLENEIAGHEWWSADGKTIWYQIYYPRGMNTSYLGGYNVETGARIWYHFEPDAASIHHNSSPDGTLFCGDGNRMNPWIVLCRPVSIPDQHTLGHQLIKGGYLKAERLVNMAKHDYALEPNPSFTPDQKLILFAANFFGPTYVFGVEVAKSTSP
jgi:oligogalacturonide lyase